MVEGEVLLFLTACAGQSAQRYSVLSYLGNQVEGQGDSQPHPPLWPPLFLTLLTGFTTFALYRREAFYLG